MEWLVKNEIFHGMVVFDEKKPPGWKRGIIVRSNIIEFNVRKQKRCWIFLSGIEQDF